ncbi:hypothetical protein LQK93_03821 [Terrabacter sp. BE26]
MEQMRGELWADLLIRSALMAVCLGAAFWAYSNGHDVIGAVGATAVGGLLGGSLSGAIRKVWALRKKQD